MSHKIENMFETSLAKNKLMLGDYFHDCVFKIIVTTVTSSYGYLSKEKLASLP